MRPTLSFHFSSQQTHLIVVHYRQFYCLVWLLSQFSVLSFLNISLWRFKKLLALATESKMSQKITIKKRMILKVNMSRLMTTNPWVSSMKSLKKVLLRTLSKLFLGSQFYSTTPNYVARKPHTRKFYFSAIRLRPCFSNNQ